MLRYLTYDKHLCTNKLESEISFLASEMDLSFLARCQNLNLCIYFLRWQHLTSFRTQLQEPLGLDCRYYFQKQLLVKRSYIVKLIIHDIFYAAKWPEQLLITDIRSTCICKINGIWPRVFEKKTSENGHLSWNYNLRQKHSFLGCCQT